uniref:Uncharacterized protein n=1 Tax=Myotis myotis TaxID=51298 RepID=A0A7J8ANA7_MYOMY|nr:hypothetical protein mMyoMyo1_008160 [Myotis myotis]
MRRQASLALCLRGHGHLGRGSCSARRRGSPHWNPGKRSDESEASIPPTGLLFLYFQGEAEVGGPRSGSCWNWPQAWKPLKAFEETGRTSGLKNKTIRLPTRCGTPPLPQAALITEMAGAGEWREHPV